MERIMNPTLPDGRPQPYARPPHVRSNSKPGTPQNLPSLTSAPNRNTTSVRAINNQNPAPRGYSNSKPRPQSISNIHGFDQPRDYYNKRRQQTEIYTKPTTTKPLPPQKNFTGSSTGTGRSNAMPPKPIPKPTVVDKFTVKPSSRLTQMKTNDIFADNSKKGKNSNTFRQFYDSGGIPCRILHGGVKMRIQWDCGMDPSLLPFDPFLVKFFEG